MMVMYMMMMMMMMTMMMTIMMYMMMMMTMMMYCWDEVRKTSSLKAPRLLVILIMLLLVKCFL